MDLSLFLILEVFIKRTEIETDTSTLVDDEILFANHAESEVFIRSKLACVLRKGVTRATDRFRSFSSASKAVARSATGKNNGTVPSLPSSLTAHLFTQSHEATKTKGEHLWRTNHLHAHCTPTIEFIASIVRKRAV